MINRKILHFRPLKKRIFSSIIKKMRFFGFKRANGFDILNVFLLDMNPVYLYTTLLWFNFRSLFKGLFFKKVVVYYGKAYNNSN